MNMKKVEITCYSCGADCIIHHEMLAPFDLFFCPFCGEDLSKEDFVMDEVDYDDEDDIDDW